MREVPRWLCVLYDAWRADSGVLPEGADSPSLRAVDEATSQLADLDADGLLESFHRLLAVGWIAAGSEHALDLEDWLLARYRQARAGRASTAARQQPAHGANEERELLLAGVVERQQVMIKQQRTLVQHQQSLIEHLARLLSIATEPRLVPADVPGFPTRSGS